MGMLNFQYDTETRTVAISIEDVTAKDSIFAIVHITHSIYENLPSEEMRGAFRRTVQTVMRDDSPTWASKETMQIAVDLDELRKQMIEERESEVGE